MSLKQLFRILWARRLIVLIATLGCLLGATVPVMRLPWRYQATAKLLIDLSTPDPVSGASIPGKALSAYVNTQLLIIRDYRVTGAVVDALGWMSAPNLIDQYNRRDPGDSRDFRRYLADLIAPGVGARLLPDSNIIEVSFTGPSPEAARAIAEALRNAYVDQVLVQQREASLKTALFYDDQAARWLDRLKAKSAEATAFSRANNVVLVDSKTDLASAQLRNAEGSTVQPGAPRAQQASVSGADLMLSQADARLAAMEALLGPNHPQIIQYRAQRNALAATAVRARTSVQAPAATAASLNGQVGRVLAERGKTGQLRILTTEAALLRDKYIAARNRAVEFHRNAEATTTTLTDLGRTVGADKPVFPNLPFVFGGALVLGLLLGALVALLTELLHMRVRGPEELPTTRMPVFVLPR